MCVCAKPAFWETEPAEAGDGEVTYYWRLRMHRRYAKAVRERVVAEAAEQAEQAEQAGARPGTFNAKMPLAVLVGGDVRGVSAGTFAVTSHRTAAALYGVRWQNLYRDGVMQKPEPDQAREMVRMNEQLASLADDYDFSARYSNSPAEHQQWQPGDEKRGPKPTAPAAASRFGS